MKTSHKLLLISMVVLLLPVIYFLTHFWTYSSCEQISQTNNDKETVITYRIIAPNHKKTAVIVDSIKQEKIKQHKEENREK